MPHKSNRHLPYYLALLPLTLIVAIGLTTPQRTEADGIRNPFQGAAAIAQGNAFAAQADDPTAVFYNPAGMTQLHGVQHTVGVQFVSVNTRFTSQTGGSVANERPFPIGLPPPGQLFVTANLKDLGVHALGDLSVGLGLQNLFGFAAKYPRDGPFASAVTFAQFPLLDIKPTLAYKVTDRLSVGLGADIFTFASFLGEGHLEQRSIQGGTTVELNGKGTTAGLNASLLYKVLQTEDGEPLLNLAFVWRSQAVLPVNGELRVNGALMADASSSIRLPEIYTWGLAVWPVRNRDRQWKVEVDVDYARWQSIRDFDVRLSNGTTIANPQRWNNAVSVGIGTEYKWLSIPNHPDWSVAIRTGYLHSEAAIPDVNFNPAAPDAPVHVLSVGLGFLCKENGRFLGLITCGGSKESRFSSTMLGLDLAYHVFLFESRSVTGNPIAAVNGIYQTTTHAGAITMRVNF
ncbi:OmpP1/FadL family transporter [Nitrospira moscoviensis]|uniref:Putative long-chain fatty acid outer membrane transporter n=1 Tax=Nitrospira moscoviensis TaxID=42253 RepID=A0A0K2GA58_NITMO|nr:outer membrane protein transport protein [Nitrospira moscoviensis]ALA57462.1 putative long-chain fatty acid outer membrane transporter [Nitrospira moscoviensis]